MDICELTYLVKGPIFEVNRELGADFQEAEIRRFIL